MNSPEVYVNDEIDLAMVVKVFWQRRWWIVVAAVLGSLVSLGLAMVMTPVYRASTVLASADDGKTGGILSSAMGQLEGVASLVGLNVGSGGSRIPEVLAVLKSRQFLESFFVEKNLLPVLFSNRWSSETNTWAVSGDQVPTSGDAYRLFVRKVLDVSEDKKTSLVTLSINWRNPAQAADWANQLVSKLNMEMRARAQRQADTSVGFLKKELEITQDIGTREAINRLMEAAIRQRMLANTNQEYAFRVVEQAVAPELKDKVSPQKWLMVVAGFLVAVILCLSGILMYESQKKDTGLYVAEASEHSERRRVI